jgi:hypothetical protein
LVIYGAYALSNGLIYSLETYVYSPLGGPLDLFTLLQQLGLNALEFTWSRNLFNPTTPEFAFYESDDGVGWITPDGYFVYSNRTGDLMEITLNNQIKDSVIMDGKSYLQVLFQQFMDY